VLLGDSITEITCWRPQVWTQLVSANLSSDVDFVGSMTDIQANCAKPAGFQTKHEGHSGYQVYDVVRNNIAGWVRDTKPDVVQFMLGTNDVNIGKRNAQSIQDSYTGLVTALRAANPKVHIIVSCNWLGKERPVR
jgi:lysophospholipase L1-like esterase